MTFTEAIEKGKQQARDRKRCYYVCFGQVQSALDWRNSYGVSEYLGYPAAYPDRVCAQIFPDGRVVNRAGEPLTV